MQRRPQELHAPLEIGVAALVLGEGGGRQQDIGLAVLGPEQKVPDRGEAGGGRRGAGAHDQHGVAALQVGLLAEQAQREGAALVGAAV